MAKLKQLLDDAGLRIEQSNVAEGGSASIHKCSVIAESPELPPIGSFIAVKEYKSGLLEVSGQRERIRQEAEIGKRIKHPNFVQTYGVLGLQDSKPGSACALLLEWVDGQNLASWYKEQSKPIHWARLQEIAIGLADAVEHIHQEGVHHRDIKPENVMIRVTGAPVLMDVGVSELTDDNEHTLHTSIKDFVGSARYASPQFILGSDKFAPADDVYSLGATLYLLLTGQEVYAEVERKTVIPIRVVTGAPRVESLTESVPASMNILLEGSLHRERDRRPTIQEVRECLAQPDKAAYIARELERQTADKRSYKVLHVEDDKSFIADLAGDNPRNGETYTVVRLLNPINVPSYNREVTPEIWVASAKLKHKHQNLGHFIVVEKYWRPARTVMPFGLHQDNGKWVEEESYEPKVQVDDRVLKGR